MEHRKIVFQRIFRTERPNHWVTSSTARLSAVLQPIALHSRATGESPAALIPRITSPGGTTVRGLKVLEDAGLTGSVMEAVIQASLRAKELEG